MSVGGLKTTVNVLYARGEMFNHEALITRWQQQPEPYGAIDYGVIVKPVTPNPGELYWRCLGAYHLRPEENRGGQNVFCAVRGEAGARVRMAIVAIDNNGIKTQAVCDKPANEPDTNAIMFFNDTLALQVDYAGLRSDTVAGFHTRHPDEHGPRGERWNSVGHHSFFTAWQLTTAAGQPQPEPEPPPVPEPPAYEPLSRFTVWRYYKNAGWTPAWTGDDLAVAFTKYVDHTVEAGPAGHVYLMVRL